MTCCGRCRAEQSAIARRRRRELPDLNGKTVAELWDVIFRGETVIRWCANASSSVSGVKFVGYQEFGNFHGAREHEVVATLPDKLRAMPRRMPSSSASAPEGAARPPCCGPWQSSKSSASDRVHHRFGLPQAGRGDRQGLGVPLAMGVYPGAPMVDSEEVLKRKVEEELAPGLLV